YRQRQAGHDRRRQHRMHGADRRRHVSSCGPHGRASRLGDRRSAARIEQGLRSRRKTRTPIDTGSAATGGPPMAKAKKAKKAKGKKGKRAVAAKKKSAKKAKTAKKSAK